MLTTHVFVESVKSVKHWDKKESTHVDVDCPAAVANCNNHMDGVDLLEAFLSYYRIYVHSKK